MVGYLETATRKARSSPPGICRGCGARGSRRLTSPPGHSITVPSCSLREARQLGRCLVLLAPDPFIGLEEYAALCGRLHHVQLKPILHGWCSWFYARIQATEAEQLRNAAFIAQHLKPYGMQWVQIDDGYQRAFGGWEANELYPHGMAWLATEIRRLGLQPGIWLAPYAVSEHASLVQTHPEWLARRRGADHGQHPWGPVYSRHHPSWSTAMAAGTYPHRR